MNHGGAILASRELNSISEQNTTGHQIVIHQKIDKKKQNLCKMLIGPCTFLSYCSDLQLFFWKLREQTFKISKWTKVYFWFDKKEIIKFVRVDDWCPPISKVVLNHIVIWRKFVFISLFSGLRLCVVRDLHLTCINLFFFAIIIKNFENFTLELNFCVRRLES